MLSTISKTNCWSLKKKDRSEIILDDLFFCHFIRILLILYGILLKIHFVCDRMKVIKIRKANKVMTNQLIYTGKS